MRARSSGRCCPSSARTKRPRERFAVEARKGRAAAESIAGRGAQRTSGGRRHGRRECWISTIHFSEETWNERGDKRILFLRRGRVHGDRRAGCHGLLPLRLLSKVVGGPGERVHA